MIDFFSVTNKSQEIAEFVVYTRGYVRMNLLSTYSCDERYEFPSRSRAMGSS